MLRKIKQLYFLKPIDKKILYNIISADNLPSVQKISDKLGENQKDIEKKINTLYRYRVIKNIIPIVNLKLFGIKTFLATLFIPKYVDYPEEYLEDYLCYSANTGWVTKCENSIYRVAIFAGNQMDATSILDEIRSDLNTEFEYDLHDLQCSYAIGEKNLFLNLDEEVSLDADSMKYNSNEVKTFDKAKLTYEEFFVLKQIENLRKPTMENIDQKIFHKGIKSVNETITKLKQKKVIEQLLVRMDTRMLGYGWYIIFAYIEINQINKVVEYLKTRFNNITHINALVSSKSAWNLDFEVHVLSYADINIIMEQIQKEFNNSISFKEDPLKIIRECKFSFLTHYVSDIILKDYILENEDI